MIEPALDCVTKERPILFSGPMVRAILAGTKTQTRRVVKCPHKIIGLATPKEWNAGRADERMVPFEQWKDRSLYHLLRIDTGSVIALPCQYGEPGDRLWVRETFGGECAWDWRYRADVDPATDGWRWKPAIHMPRAACRIVLEVTAIRAERLQDITEGDAQAEGAEPFIAGQDAKGPLRTYRTGFVHLWQSINGTWLANPWVWVVEFKRA